MMKSVATGTLLAILFALAIGQNPPKNYIPRLTADEWRQDLHVLATEVARRHKNAFAYAAKEKFDRAVADLDKRIPPLKGYEIMVGMMRILALVGDGHTRCDDVFNNFSQFPIELYWFGDDLRVIRTTPEYKEALGKRVIAIGSTPIAAADQDVRGLIEKHETEGWIKRFSAYDLSPEILKSLGIVLTLNAQPSWSRTVVSRNQ
jgi:hypothetical protein